MSIVGKWMEKRRHNELDKVNREIELLKKKGLDYERETGAKDKIVDKKAKTPKVNRDANFKLLLIICLCLIVIAGITIFYRHNLSSLKIQYDDKLKEVELLTNDLLNKSSTLSDINSRLNVKEQAEEELSGQYLELESEKESLSKQADTLRNTLTQRDSEIETLKQDIQKRDKDVKDLKSCITQELDSSLSICGF